MDGTTVQADVLVPGEHMVLNGAAALLAGHLAGGDVEKLAEGLSGFTGVRRGCSGGAVELQSARNYVASSLKVSAPSELVRKGRAEHVSWYLHSKA